MALNIKLRGSASLVPVADDVGINGDFAYSGGRFYYAYVSKFGEGKILRSTDRGRTWGPYDSLGQISNIAARGDLVAWTEGKRGVVYDIQQQWEIVNAYPFDPETYTELGRIIPIPEIDAVHFLRSGGDGAPQAGATKALSNFGIWDAPVDTVSTATGGFTYTQRTFLGLWGDQRRGGGLQRAYDSYLVESWFLGSPSTSTVVVNTRQGVGSSEDEDAPLGEHFNTPYGTRGFEGSLVGIEGVMTSQRRGPPGLGTHGRGIPASLYTVRMDGQQVGLRGLSDVHGSDINWAHGGAWVDEYNLVAATGAIGGYHGSIFLDAAGNIVMVKRSGSQFGEWSEAKSYGNPGFHPQSLWLPNAYATVRAGIYGAGQAWMLIDDDPNFIPRGRLVGGDYIAPDPEASKVANRFRKVTFW